MSMMVAVACVAFAGVSGVLWQRQSKARREAHIRDFTLPKGLFDKLCKQHPQLTMKDCHLVAQGLRQFFLAYLQSGCRHVAMPSQVVDDLWHEFILYTKNYEQFCKQAFGQFLHHTPAEALNQSQRGDAGLRRCWYQACRQENIDPRNPSRLPLLFALDTKLDIVNGFAYVPDCHGVRRQADTGAAAHCGADIGASGCGGGGSIDSDSGSSDGGSCGGGGCGGD